MKTAIRIHLEKAPADYDLGASKFFGDPTVPGAWAERFADDIVFFGQIRLSDIAPHDPEGRLPHTGYLYFFLDVAQYPYDIWVEHYDGEPDTLIEGFNEEEPAFAHLHQAFLMSFSPCGEGEDGTRLFGIPSSGYEGDAPLLLQFDPLDTSTGFLEEIDGYAYVFLDPAEGLDSAAVFVIDRS